MRPLWSFFSSDIDDTLRTFIVLRVFAIERFLTFCNWCRFFPLICLHPCISWTIFWASVIYIWSNIPYMHCTCIDLRIFAIDRLLTFCNWGRFFPWCLLWTSFRASVIYISSNKSYTHCTWFDLRIFVIEGYLTFCNWCRFWLFSSAPHVSEMITVT